MDRDATDHGSTRFGGREVRGSEPESKRLQGREFTPEFLSAHVVGFRPSPVTSRVVQRTGVMPLTMELYPVLFHCQLTVYAEGCSSTFFAALHVSARRIK